MRILQVYSLFSRKAKKILMADCNPERIMHLKNPRERNLIFGNIISIIISIILSQSSIGLEKD